MTPKIQSKSPGALVRCVIYARVSTDKQAKHNISVPDQVAQAEAYAASNDRNVVETYIDSGSGKDDSKRPQFRKMVAVATEDEPGFEVVLVHNYSRFYRDHILFGLVQRELRKNGVHVRSLSQEIDTDDDSGMFQLSIQNLLDEQKSRETSRDVRRTMKANARDGFNNGGTVPVGYKLEVVEPRGQRNKHKLAVDSDEAAIVKQMFEGVLKGDGIRAIAIRLNDLGCTTRKGNLWGISNVHAILKNEAYAGRRYFRERDRHTGEMASRDKWIEVPCPPIVDEDTFQRVQGLLADRAPNVVAPRSLTSTVLLSGLAHCGACGRVLCLATGTGRSGEVYRYLKCAGKLKHGACEGGDPVTIAEDELNRIVMTALIEELLVPDRISDIVSEVFSRRQNQQGAANDCIKRLNGDMARLKRQEKNLWEAVASTGLQDVDTFKETIANLVSRREAITRQIRVQQDALSQAIDPVTKSQASEFALKTRQAALDASFEVRKRFVRTYVSKVIVSGDELQIIGRKSALAEAANDRNVTPDPSARAVRGFDQEWCRLQDSNL